MYKTQQWLHGLFLYGIAVLSIARKQVISKLPFLFITDWPKISYENGGFFCTCSCLKFNFYSLCKAFPHNILSLSFQKITQLIEYRSQSPIRLKQHTHALEFKPTLPLHSNIVEPLSERGWEVIVPIGWWGQIVYKRWPQTWTKSQENESSKEWKVTSTSHQMDS